MSQAKESFAAVDGLPDLAVFLDSIGALYVAALLALHPLGADLRFVDGKLILERTGEAIAVDELRYREEVDKLSDLELDALLVHVREVEARLTRDLRRRRISDATHSPELR